MTKQVFQPHSDKPFKISRSGLELMSECPRCFYLGKRLGIQRPRGLPFTINSAVDELLKREFDEYRKRAEPHPLMTAAGIDAIPYSHPDLSKWRQTYHGVSHHHRSTGLIIHGAVDDLWKTPHNALLVVDYKATAKKHELTTLDQRWHGRYKRQIEIYQWLLRRNGFTVADRSWLVYANGDASAARFNQAIHFRMTLVPHDGDDSWVEEHVCRAAEILRASAAPPAAQDCEWCRFAREASNPMDVSGAGGQLAEAPGPVSSGTLLYRFQGDGLEVLLVRAASHDSGKTPLGIPKGTLRADESLEAAARRETLEETGVVAPAALDDLGSVTSHGYRKTVHCFAGLVDAQCQPRCASPEVDWAGFVAIEKARRVMRKYQAELLDRLSKLLQQRMNDEE